MKICVVGLWHLGSVTAACCARHFDVTGLDFDPDTVARLQQGKAPLFEPGLDALLQMGLSRKTLAFTDDPAQACANADVLWLTYDTPVNDQDESDVNCVLEQLRRCLPHLPDGALVLISSQLPVGTCRKLEAQFPRFHFAYSPENLRLGRAIDAFEKPERVVVGMRDEAKKDLLAKLFAPFTANILWMRTESAEMVKHGLNAFLAVSVTFINELARLCEQMGADACEVAAGLKSDPRIGARAYLGPGGAFAGGTLARDVVTLSKLGEQTGQSLHLIPAIKRSNDQHRHWPRERLKTALQSPAGKTITVLGLTYTPNTDTLRRSAAVELCRTLLADGARVRAFDPVIRQLPEELAAVTLAGDLAAALDGADAAVVCTEWPQFREANWAELLPRMRRRLIVDANGFLEKELKSRPEVEHLSVGRAT